MEIIYRGVYLETIEEDMKNKLKVRQMYSDRKI